ncbi:MAG: hypothetical protein ACOX5G_11260 [Kiritimatiellia bacterium]|jgi:hypothetical protein
MTYSPTRTDLATFRSLDRLFAPDAPLEGLLAALDADQWQLQQGALWALAGRMERPLPHDTLAAIAEAVLALLDDQDGRGVYAAPSPKDYRGADPAKTEEHRCRFRVKQAACMALAPAAMALPPGNPLHERAVARLERYAVDLAEDYAVRAECCRALGRIALPRSRGTLEQASTDGEWCTATEARKALARLA